MSLRSWFYKRSVLSDLKKIKRLPREAQAAIAAKAGALINMGAVSNETLPLLYHAATQGRYDALEQGASSIADPRWAAAVLAEAWFSAKLGLTMGKLDEASAAVILTSIEGFIFDHEHEKWLR